MHISRLWMYTAAAFLIGSAVAFIFTVPASLLIVLLCLGIVVLFGCIWFRKWVVLPFILVISAMCFGWLHGEAQTSVNEYAGVLSKPTEFEGRVVEAPDVRADKIVLTILPDGHRQKIVAWLAPTDEYTYGDRVWFVGRLQAPAVFETFNYKAYLAAQGVTAVSFRPRLVVLAQASAWHPITWILKVKEYAQNQIRARVGNKQSGVVIAMLIGGKAGLSQELQDQFAAAGLSHILVVSGFNISLLVGLVIAASFYIGKKAAFVLGVILLIFFYFLTGGGASIMRAVWMGLLLLITLQVGRLYTALPALLTVAACMVYANPLVLAYDASFQLSFAATAGILYGAPLLEHLTEKLPNPFSIKSIFLITCLANFSVLPIVLFHFGGASIIAPITNIIVLPFVPLLMLLGACAVIPGVGFGFGWLASGLVDMLVWFVSRVSGISFSQVHIEMSLPESFLLGLAVLVSFFLLRLLAYSRLEAEKFLLAESTSAKIAE